MRLRHIGFILPLAFVLLIFPRALYAFSIPPNDGFVTDTVGLLSPTDKASINDTLSQYRTSTSNEIAVVIVPTLSGDPIETVSLDIFRKWGIGSTKNNGILILIAYDDHLVRIEVGYGLEGAVPDIATKGIIDTDITPAFRDGKYADGLRAAINALTKHIGGEYTASRYDQPEQSSGPLPFVFFLFFLLLQWVLSILSRTKSWWLGGVFGGVAGIVLGFAYGSAWLLSIPVLVILGLLLDYLVSRNYQSRGHTRWWAGGGWGPGGPSGSGGFGGGFGGFGGGSSGGGGASGRW